MLNRLTHLLATGIGKIGPVALDGKPLLNSIQMKGENFFIDDSRIPTGFSVERLGRFLESQQAQQRRQHSRLQESLKAWQEKYRAEETKLIGSNVRNKLTDYMNQNRRPEPDATQERRLMPVGQLDEERRRRRLQSLRFAQDINLDLTSMKRLRRAANQEFEQLIKPAVALTNRLVIEEPDQAFLYQPIAVPLPQTVVPKAAFLPLYPGWWDRRADSYQSGDGRAINNDSYLWWETSRSGSYIRSRNKNADDFDYLDAYRENGFLVPYQTTQNGILRIKFEVECAFSQHCLQTHDEFGWSDYNAWTNERAVASVFWNWEDINPATESVDMYFVWGLDGSGDGENSPGVVFPVPAGQQRTLSVYTNMSFPAGVMLWVYVGTQQRFSATVNDVGINTFVSSGWYVKRIQVDTV